eukprot:UN04977
MNVDSDKPGKENVPITDENCDDILSAIIGGDDVLKDSTPKVNNKKPKSKSDADTQFSFLLDSDAKKDNDDMNTSLVLDDITKKSKQQLLETLDDDIGSLTPKLDKNDLVDPALLGLDDEEQSTVIVGGDNTMDTDDKRKTTSKDLSDKPTLDDSIVSFLDEPTDLEQTTTTGKKQNKNNFNKFGIKAKKKTKSGSRPGSRRSSAASTDTHVSVADGIDTERELNIENIENYTFRIQNIKKMKTDQLARLLKKYNSKAAKSLNKKVTHFVHAHDSFESATGRYTGELKKAIKRYQQKSLKFIEQNLLINILKQDALKASESSNINKKTYKERNERERLRKKSFRD